MSIDVRIDPEVSTQTVAGVSVRVSSLFLGGVPRGAVLIVAGPDGLSLLQAIDTMNALAQHGYESAMAEPAEDRGGDDVARGLIQHLAALLTARGWTHEQIGVIGYGHGARAALVAGSETTFGAAISVPRDARTLLEPDRIVALQTPWLCLAGLGEHAGSAELSAYGDEVESASSQHTAVVGYQGVHHCLDDSVEPVVHQAAFDTWQRTAEWLNIHVAPRPTPLVEAWEARHGADRPTHL